MLQNNASEWLTLQANYVIEVTHVSNVTIFLRHHVKMLLSSIFSVDLLDWSGKYCRHFIAVKEKHFFAMPSSFEKCYAAFIFSNTYMHNNLSNFLLGCFLNTEKIK